jgi:hypothetical protein
MAGVKEQGISPCGRKVEFLIKLRSLKQWSGVTSAGISVVMVKFFCLAIPQDRRRVKEETIGNFKTRKFVGTLESHENEWWIRYFELSEDFVNK